MTTRGILPGIDADIWSICSGTDSTMSNLLGPGRVVSNLISLGGRRIEGVVNTIARKLGYGPTGPFLRIIAPRGATCARHRDHYWQDTFEALRSQPSCERLIDYTRFWFCRHCRARWSDRVSRDSSVVKDADELQDYVASCDPGAQILAIEFITLLWAINPSIYELFSCFHVQLETAKRRFVLPEYHTTQLGALVDWALKRTQDKAMLSSMFTTVWNESFTRDSTDHTYIDLWRYTFEEDSRFFLGKRWPFIVLLQLNTFSDFYRGLDTTGLLAFFPSRDVISDLLRMAPVMLPWHILQGTLQVLWQSVTEASQPAVRHRAAADLWVPLLEARLASQNAFPVLHIWPSYAVPHVLEALGKQGREVIRHTLAHDNHAWHSTENFNDVLCTILFQYEGALPADLQAWVKSAVEALERLACVEEIGKNGTKEIGGESKRDDGDGTRDGGAGYCKDSGNITTGT